jgi:ABC-type sugar transport system ATPase subunit
VPPGGALEGRGLTKRFGGVTALDSVDFTVVPGRITALLGENGAGKSTLVACLSGAQQPDGGEILVDGLPRALRSPEDARRAGIAVVHQEPQMLEEQTVAANLYLPRLARGAGVAARPASLERAAAELLASLGIRGLDPGRPMRIVAGAQRQLVEIARALVGDPTMLFLDEPNASLGEAETESLFTVIRGLRDRGVGVVLVSHRLREVYEVADHVVVMRDGRKVADADVTALPIDEAVRHIVGDGAARPSPRPDTRAALGTAPIPDPAAAPVLEVEGITGPGFVGVTFAIRSGEIVGMSGLVGSGRTEIALGVVGATRLDGGTISLGGRRVSIADPSDAVRQGVVFVPEGRRDAIFYGRSVDFNIRAGMWGRLGDGMRRPSSAEARRRVIELMSRLSVKAASPDVLASTLSGGNQQKLLFARALGTRPRLLILDEPTHGVDVGTKRETHDLIRSLAADGMAIWFISSEVEEIADLAQRVLVVRHGRLVADLPGATSIEDILAANFGTQGRSRGD